jgi:hypothetical protein
LSSGAKRFFRVSGRAPAGKKGVAIRAKNRKRGALETQLQAIVLKAKPMKVSLRQIQVFSDDTRKTTTMLSQGAFDPKALLDHMNMVWANQANISWALGRTDPALVDAIDIRSQGPNRDNDAQNKAVSANCDQRTDLTIFFPARCSTPTG